MSCSLLGGSWCWRQPVYTSLYISPWATSCCKGNGMECSCRMVQLQKHTVTRQLCRPQPWAGIIAGHHTQHKAQDYGTTAQYFVQLLRDSQWKTTMCGTRFSTKVLWSQRRDIIDYSWLWVKPTDRKQNWYLSKPKRLFFFPAFDWFCHSLVIPCYFLLQKA